MIRLYGFNTQNSLKTLYVAEESGLDFEFVFVDLGKGEHRSEEFARMTPIRKVPVLEHDGEYLFESGAICRYLGNLTESELYPADKMRRAKVDQWLDFFSIHLGHWFTVMFYEQVIKTKYGLGEPDQAKLEEAGKSATQQLKTLNRTMSEQEYLANNALSIADLFAFAYVEQHAAIEFSLSDYPAVESWMERIGARDSVGRVRTRMEK